MCLLRFFIGVSMVDFDKNTPLVYYVFNKYYKRLNKSQYKEDLIQCGMLGLWKACKSFNEKYNCRFSTYAGICIKNEMGMFLRKENKFLGNTIDAVFLDENNAEIDIFDYIEDKNWSNVGETINLKYLVNDTEIVKEILKKKTLTQVAQEQDKTIRRVRDQYAREKKFIEDMIKD